MIEATTLTRNLGGKWHGGYGSAACPVCQPERRRDQNALSIANGGNGRLLLHCHKAGCSFLDVIKATGIQGGEYAPPDAAIVAKRAAEQKALDAKKARQALTNWSEAEPILNTPAEVYLRGRGITGALPKTLRYHPSCWHASAKRLPAMIAAIEGGNDFGVHRIYLSHDGRQKAKVDPVKAMLGAVSGGAVRLKLGRGPLMVGEGIESTLSASILYDDPEMAVWAALSTSGMSRLNLPRLGGFGGFGNVRPSLIVAVDGDKAGRLAGRDLAERANAQGWHVDIMDPGDGADWNDRLIKQEGYS